MTVDDGVNPPVTTNYLLDGQNVIREIVGENVTATYLNGYRGIEYREDANGEKAWYLYDGLGCVIGEMADDGTMTATRTYKAFGGIRSSSGSGGSHKFCGSLGHTADASCGLTYMRARYYDPVIGRFISEDPAYQGGNWYAYCGNNPVNLTDPDGKAAMDIWTMAAYIGMGLGFFGAMGFALGSGEVTPRALLNAVGAGAGGGIAMGCFAAILKKVWKSPGGGNLIPQRIGTWKTLGVAAGTSFFVGVGVGVAMQLGERAGEAMFELFMLEYFWGK